ncbi:hypothetical protein [Psychroserpens sp. Hel_I_66]|uniref:hypothetical protein n=1 Tax=Psychroserpens sp. Hel_I_66 TaxID=1250004 RepID=UPI0006474929|nr:hypothetical protein [Psychroserpens sp. Hel_I_66]
MKYLETKHEQNSAKITALIVVILVLLLFVVGPPYMDPPEEYGVAVNFGNSEVGTGNIQPTEPIKSQPTEEVVKEEKQAQPTETSASNTKSEDVLTNESPEAIAIKKAKAAEAKAKAEADRKEAIKKAAEAKKAREEKEAKDKLDALIGGVKNSEGTKTGGEGPGDGPGDKGQLDGDPYAPSYFGGSGPGKGGVGSGLGGRGQASKQIFKQDCNEYGLVVVKIIVNQQGKVIEAEPGIKGSTNTNPCLLAPAKKIALSHKWPADPKAPSKQVGFVSINFDVSQ